MEIELTRPHTHDGREYATGDTLTMDSALAGWLIRNKIAKAAPAKIEDADTKTKGGKNRWEQKVTL